MSAQSGGAAPDAEIIDALHAALDGEAIAFLGAGYAFGATNVVDRSLPTAKDLASRLAATLDVPLEPGTTLADISDYFADRDEDGLHRYLQEEFQIKATLPAQQAIATVPWKRVYTTNYDDVFEQSARLARRAFYSAVPADTLEVLRKSPNVCLHINGAVSRLATGGFKGDFRLTESSYANSSFLKTAWATQLVKDVYNARAVLFIGYSLHDLEVQQILADMDSIGRKVWFVAGANLNPIAKRKLERFGRVFDGGVLELANILTAARSNHSPTKPRLRLPICLAPIEPPSTTRAVTAEGLARLFLAGGTDPAMMWHVTPEIDNKYVCQRTRTSAILQDINATRHVVITGGLGNGKTVLLDALGMAAFRSGITAYRLKQTTSNEERAHLSEFLAASGRVLIIADAYDQTELEVRAALHAPGAGVQLLLAARPINHDVSRRWLGELLANDYREYSIDKLTETELDWFVARFDEGAFWGNLAAWTLQEKRAALESEKFYHGELCGVLLGLLKSDHIRQRVNELVEDLETTGPHIDAVILVLVLSVTEQSVDEGRIVQLLGSDALSRAKFREHPSVATFLQARDGDFRARSSVVARHILKESVNPMRTVRVLEKAVRAAAQMSLVDDSMERLAIELVRAARVQSVLPENTKRPVVEFYEAVRDVHFFQQNVQFWLQYAIALMAVSEYPDARRKLDTAYGLASRNYRTFMLDTTNARLHLEDAIHSSHPPSSDEAMKAFRKARDLLSGVLTDRDRDQAFRAAERYADFLKRFVKELSSEARTEIARAIVHVLNVIEKRGHPADIGMRALKCKKKLRAALDENFERTIVQEWLS